MSLPSDANELRTQLGRPYEPLFERFGSRHAELLGSIEGATRARLVAEPCGEVRFTLSVCALDCKGVLAVIRATLPGLAVFDARWSDVETRALSPTSAVTSFLFRDSIVTLEGETTVMRGPSTLVWEKRGDDWLIVYVDADHYPPD